jgi:RNA polymerase sigma-70 factor (ECF subfamily)
MMLSDEQLMTRFQAGERGALGELVKRHSRAVFHFAMRHVRSPQVAEDVAQDAFVRLVQSGHDFKPEARFLTWLFTIVRNLCIDHLRKAAHRRHPSLDQPRPGDDGDGPSLLERTADRRADVERGAVSSELSVRISAAVELLPDEQREVFLLREVGNVPFKDIAELTGVSENTVKSRMRYALERLQAALREYEEYAKTLK